VTSSAVIATTIHQYLAPVADKYLHSQKPQESTSPGIGNRRSPQILPGQGSHLWTEYFACEIFSESNQAQIEPPPGGFCDADCSATGRRY